MEDNVISLDDTAFYAYISGDQIVRNFAELTNKRRFDYPLKSFYSIENSLHFQRLPTPVLVQITLNFFY